MDIICDAGFGYDLKAVYDQNTEVTHAIDALLKAHKYDVF